MVMDWIGQVHTLGLEREGIEPEALARVHARFEQIHPFLDGNGRTGRLVLNLLLVRLGYPPAIVFKGDRRRYLAALGNADQGDHGPLAELLARAILDNLHKFVVPAIAGPSRLVPLPALASERISANALRVAATRGRLNASKAADGTWRSTRAWVDEYLAERYARSAVRAGLAAAAPPSRGFRVRAQPLGIRPDIDIDKALSLAAELEDAEILRKLDLRK
jgi:hypothetical protein